MAQRVTQWHMRSKKTSIDLQSPVLIQCSLDETASCFKMSYAAEIKEPMISDNSLSCFLYYCYY